MSNVKTLLFGMLFGLFLTSVANADYTLGPYETYGYGINETQAFANAEYEAWLAADEIEEGLPEGHVVFILSYAPSSEWNDPEYKLVYFIHVID